MNIEKLNELEKCLQVLRMDEFMTDKDFYQDLVTTTLEKVVMPLIDSLEKEDNTDDKLFKFLTKLERNLKAVIVVKMRLIKDNDTLFKTRHNIQQWIKYYEDKLKEILDESIS
jgi:hypothetical protein